MTLAISLVISDANGLEDDRTTDGEADDALNTSCINPYGYSAKQAQPTGRWFASDSVRLVKLVCVHSSFGA